MGLDPITIGMLGSAGAGLVGSLFGKKKKATEYTSTKAPAAQGLENSINQYYQSMMGKPSPYTPMNSQMFQGANILSNAYGGGRISTTGCNRCHRVGCRDNHKCRVGCLVCPLVCPRVAVVCHSSHGKWVRVGYLRGLHRWRRQRVRGFHRDNEG